MTRRNEQKLLGFDLDGSKDELVKESSVTP